MNKLRDGAWCPYFLALVFLASYALVTSGFHSALMPFVSLKMDLPTPAILPINSAVFLRSSWLSLILFSLAFGIAIGEKFAWWTGFVLSIIFALAPLLMARTLIMMNNGSLPVIMAPPIRVPPVLPWIILTCLAMIPPLLFLALRRTFWKQQPRRDQTLRA